MATGEWPSLHLHDALDRSTCCAALHHLGRLAVRRDRGAGRGVYPVRVRRFYVAETDAAAQYTGEMIIDDIVAKVPPRSTPPPREHRTDRVVVTDGTVDGAPWRFAVLSDAQFVAADPDSDLVAQARRTLREIRAARPDFLLITGDFVDTAYPADFALAKRILDEELGGELPYYYVPGNHEIMGAPISNFQAAFGATTRVFDHRRPPGSSPWTPPPAVSGRRVRPGTDATRDAGRCRRRPARRIGGRVGAPPAARPHPGEGQPARRPEGGGAAESVAGRLPAGDRQGRAVRRRARGHLPRRPGGRGAVRDQRQLRARRRPPRADQGGFTGWTMFGVDPVSPAEAARPAVTRSTAGRAG